MNKPRCILEGGKIRVFSRFQDKEKCKLVPGYSWHKFDKCWEYPASSAVVTALIEAFDGEIELSSQVIDILKMAEKATAAKTATELPTIPVTRTSPWLHQAQAYHFAYPLHGAMLAMDMGTGKSKVVVDLVINRGHSRTLILCPASVVSVWPNEFKKHAGAPVTVVCLDSRVGGVDERLKLANKQLALNHTGPVVVVINYEAAYREPFASWSKQAEFDFLVLDESHRIKAPGGKWSIYCRELSTLIPYKLALTGTPMPHSPLDVYAQYRAIDPGVFGTSFVNFRSRFAIIGRFGEVKRYQNLDELHRLFYSIAFRVESDDVLDLPEQIHIFRSAFLSSGGQKIYNEVRDVLVADVKAGRVTVNNALERLIRLQQITSGHITDDSEVSQDIDDSKRKLLADVFEDLPHNEPIVVFCRFRRDLDFVREVTEQSSRTYLELSGRENQVDKWKAKEADVLGVQIQAGGLGIDLTRARYCIYYSLGFSLGDYEQSIKRSHRPGQTRGVTYIHLLMTGTIDEQVYDALRSRKNVIETVLEKIQ